MRSYMQLGNNLVMKDERLIDVIDVILFRFNRHVIPHPPDLLLVLRKTFLVPNDVNV